MAREYVVWKRYSYDGKMSLSSEYRSFDSDRDMKPTLQAEYASSDDPNLVNVVVQAASFEKIDYELSERMSAIRDICELGHKVRALSKIRNRQPLRNAYVAFSDGNVRDYMIYLDNKNNDYNNTIREELNILNVEFIDEAVKDSMFDYNVKPNFKVLGPKGYGKQAQGIKAHITAMKTEDRNMLHTRLKNGECITILDVPLTYADVEVEFVAKPGMMSAGCKAGAIILDTKLDEDLLERGFVADFRSSIQNIRKEAMLELTDRISLEVYCNDKVATTLMKHKDRLARNLLITKMDCYKQGGHIHTQAHTFECGGDLDKESLSVYLYKQL